MRIYKRSLYKFRYKPKVNLVKRMASRYFNAAYKSYANGEFEKTISFYSNSIKLDSKNAAAFYNRGLALALTEKRKLAIEDFNKAILLKPNYPEAFYNRGIVYNALGDKGNALLNFSKAILLNENFVGAYFHRANFYYSAKNYQKSIEDFTSVIGIANDSTFEINLKNESFNGRGNSFYMLGELDKALADYSAAIEGGLQKNNPYDFRARIYHIRGFDDLAIADYQKSLQINNSAATNNGLGIIYYDQEKFQKALEFFNRAIESNSRSSFNYQNRGNANLKLENYSEAVEDYTKAIEFKNRNLQWAFKGRSMAYRKLGKEALAIKDEDIFYSFALNLVEDESDFIN